MDSINTKWEVRNIAEFGVIALAWDELNKRNNNQAILCASFVSALLDAFGSSEECLVLAWHENNLVFASIFEKKSRYRWQTFQPSQAPLGCIICSEDMLNEQTLKQVAKLLPSKPLLLDLTQIDSAQFPKDSTSFLFTSPYISTGSIELPSDFTAYFASLSKNARQNFNKARNRLAKLDITTKLEIVTDKDEIKKFIGRAASPNLADSAKLGSGLSPTASKMRSKIGSSSRPEYCFCPAANFTFGMSSFTKVSAILLN